MQDMSSRHAGSVVVVHRLHCLEACGVFIPRPGIEPMSTALVGGFLTFGPLGKSQVVLIFKVRISWDV